MSKKRPARQDRRVKPAEKRKDSHIIFKVESWRKERYEKAADAAEVPLCLWIRNLCDDACGKAGIE